MATNFKIIIPSKFTGFYLFFQLKFIPNLSMIFCLIFLFFCSIAAQENISNLLMAQCHSQLAQLYSEWEGGEDGHLLQNKRTLICQLSSPLQKLRLSRLLNSTSGLLQCNQLPFDTAYNAKAQIDGSIRLACFDPLANGLTILSAHFGGHTSAPSHLFLTRQHHPLWTLNDLPKPEPKFKRFPTLDLRLPPDFFYPFGGCA